MSHIETGDEFRAAARAERRQAFQDWLKGVDVALGLVIGLGHRDIADQTWRDWFDNGLDPHEAAQLALENEGLL